MILGCVVAAALAVQIVILTVINIHWINRYLRRLDKKTYYRHLLMFVISIIILGAFATPFFIRLSRLLK